jgi:phage I-like protein
MRIGYWADLGGITFGGTAANPTSWVHALPGGKYKHPMYGDLVFDDTRVTNFATSVTQKFRQIDPDIDYDHKQDPAMGNKAAGWVKAAEVRPKGTTHADFSDGGAEGLTFNNDLWVLVEWTPKGAEAIKNREWRYFSSELADEWEDPAGNKFQDVFFGGGITNRPYMKGLLPLNLSELSLKEDEDTSKYTDKGDHVDPKELRRKLGLPETATDAEVLAKATQLSEAVAKLGDPKPDPFADITKLAENNPAIAQFLELQRRQTEQLAELNNKYKLSETTRRLAELTSADAKVSLTAVVLNEARDLLMLTEGPVTEKLFAILKSVADGSGVVALGEVGRAGERRDGGQNGGKDPAERFNEEVEKLTKGDMTQYADAVDAVARMNPKLYDEYRTFSYIKPRGA